MNNQVHAISGFMLRFNYAVNGTLSRCGKKGFTFKGKIVFFSD